jgi:hypothetical protein
LLFEAKIGLPLTPKEPKIQNVILSTSGVEKYRIIVKCGTFEL